MCNAWCEHEKSHKTQKETTKNEWVRAQTEHGRCCARNKMHVRFVITYELYCFMKFKRSPMLEKTSTIIVFSLYLWMKYLENWFNDVGNLPFGIAMWHLIVVFYRQLFMSVNETDNGRRSNDGVFLYQPRGTGN